MIPAACKLCKGACCEIADIPAEIQNLMTNDRWQWLVAHAQHSDKLGHYFCSPCQFLKEGACTNYEHRFEVCRSFKIGSQDCKNVVRERRPKQWSSIYKLMEQNA